MVALKTHCARSPTESAALTSPVGFPTRNFKERSVFRVTGFSSLLHLCTIFSPSGKGAGAGGGVCGEVDSQLLAEP